MTFNTGNNVPSTSPRDLYDNAENLDKLVNGAEPFYADRLGKLRESWAGMENSFDTAQEGRETAFGLSQDDKESRFQAFLVSSGYVDIGPYAAGVEFTARNQYVAVDGQFYRPSAATAMPYVATGDWLAESESFVLLGDDVLRQELASDSGASLIGYGGGSLAQALVNIEAKAGDLVTPKMFGAVAGEDATAEIQQALDHPGSVVVISEDYMVNVEVGLYPPSGKTIVFTNAAALTSIPTSFAGYAIFKIEGKEDITFHNARLFGERYDHIGTTGEWGMGIDCRSSKRIKVLGGEAAYFWGDGLYFGASELGTETNCEDIVIRDFNSHHNRRQGLSMTGVAGAHIENSKFNDTSGTNPQSGVDIEPNAGFACKDIMFVNCQAERNAGAGFEMLDTSNSGNVENITLVNCPARANGSNGLRLVSSRKVTHTGEISGNISHGVYAIQGSNNLSLPRPDIHDNGGCGVQILTNSIGTYIGDGRIFNNLEFGASSAGRITLSAVELFNNGFGGWYFGAGAVRSKAIECYVHDNGGAGGETAAAETRVVGGEYSANSTTTNAAAHNLAIYANDCQVIGGVKSRAGNNANKPGFGLRSTSNSGLVFKGNDFRGSGVTGDIATATLTNADVSDNHPYNRMGTTAQRPTASLQIGMSYYDTTLSKPVWYFGGSSPWRGADGAAA